MVSALYFILCEYIVVILKYIIMRLITHVAYNEYTRRYNLAKIITPTILLHQLEIIFKFYIPPPPHKFLSLPSLLNILSSIRRSRHCLIYPTSVQFSTMLTVQYAHH